MKSHNRHLVEGSILSSAISLVLLSLGLFFCTTVDIFAQNAERLSGGPGGQMTTREIVAESQSVFTRDTAYSPGRNRFYNSRQPSSPETAFNAVASENIFLNAPQVAAQTVGLTFDGATGPTETGTFPPDMQAGVGPTQIVVFVNGRLRTFNKNTGVADGVLNIAPETFFASVISVAGAGESVTAIYPHVRYDRISNRWFLNMVDNATNSSTGQITRPNRILLAVSDAASNGNITPATIWTFYQFQGDAARYSDHTSFGVDASAIYIGANLYFPPDSFDNSKAWVIPKAPALAGSPLTVWAFNDLLPGGSGPFAPAAVDNPDPNNTGPAAAGYFIGVDNASFSTLAMRRITNPGSVTTPPTISGNIFVPVNATQFPVPVPHQGNTGGGDGQLDALDDRISSAMIRNGRLWTSHNIGVDNTGSALGVLTRSAARWYELQNLNGTPTVGQAGTLYDNTGPNNENQRSYWMPSVAVSGQGHSVLACSIAGANERVNAFATGRLAGDQPGSMREGPGGSSIPGITNSSFSYNPADDPGGPLGRRWGDYSMTAVDPRDDMTMWTIQQYVNGTDTYGVRVAQLIAPPPASPSGPANVSAGLASTDVTITGTAVNGSGFYDPGPNLAIPALAFNHITAIVSGTGVTVNSVTYNSPTSITLNLNTSAAAPGQRNVTVTNPDGQSRTGNNILNITPYISGTVTYGNVLGIPAGPRFVSNVTISGAGSPSVSTTTGPPGATEGQYVLRGFGSGAYTVTPSKTGNASLNGAITSFDAGRIALHVAGPPNPILNPTQRIVADVSGNGQITSFDAGMIAKLVAGPPFLPPGVGSTGTWRFTPVNRPYASITSNIAGEDFVALLMGEVSGNWTNSGARPDNSIPITRGHLTTTSDRGQSQALTSTGGRHQPTSVRNRKPKITVDLPKIATGDKEINFPVNVQGIADKNIIAYEFDLRYDPAVIQPVTEAVDVQGTASRGLTVVTNAAVPGVLRVVVYGPMAIDEDGVLLYLRFNPVGKPGSVSPLTFDQIMFNEGDPQVIATDGRIEVSAAVGKERVER